MQNMVTYPLYDLDISDLVSFKDPNACYSYDLYGVVVSVCLVFGALNLMLLFDCARTTSVPWVAGIIRPQ